MFGLMQLFNYVDEKTQNLNKTISIVAYDYGKTAGILEKEITNPFEKELAKYKDYNNITSETVENYSVIKLFYDDNTNLDQKISNLKNIIAKINKKHIQTAFYKYDIAQEPTLIITLDNNKKFVNNYQADLVNSLKVTNLYDSVFLPELSKTAGLATIKTGNRVMKTNFKGIIVKSIPFERLMSKEDSLGTINHKALEPYYKLTDRLDFYSYRIIDRSIFNKYDFLNLPVKSDSTRQIFNNDFLKLPEMYPANNSTSIRVDTSLFEYKGILNKTIAKIEGYHITSEKPINIGFNRILFKNKFLAELRNYYYTRQLYKYSNSYKNGRTLNIEPIIMLLYKNSDVTYSTFYKDIYDNMNSINKNNNLNFYFKTIYHEPISTLPQLKYLFLISMLIFLFIGLFTKEYKRFLLYPSIFIVFNLLILILTLFFKDINYSIILYSHLLFSFTLILLSILNPITRINYHFLKSYKNRYFIMAILCLNLLIMVFVVKEMMISKKALSDYHNGLIRKQINIKAPPDCLYRFSTPCSSNNNIAIGGRNTDDEVEPNRGLPFNDQSISYIIPKFYMCDFSDGNEVRDLSTISALYAVDFSSNSASIKLYFISEDLDSINNAFIKLTCELIPKSNLYYEDLEYGPDNKYYKIPKYHNDNLDYKRFYPDYTKLFKKYDMFKLNIPNSYNHLSFSNKIYSHYYALSSLLAKDYLLSIKPESMPIISEYGININTITYDKGLNIVTEKVNLEDIGKIKYLPAPQIVYHHNQKRMKEMNIYLSTFIDTNNYNSLKNKISSFIQKNANNIKIEAQYPDRAVTNNIRIFNILYFILILAAIISLILSVVFYDNIFKYLYYLFNLGLIALIHKFYLFTFNQYFNIQLMLASIMMLIFVTLLSISISKSNSSNYNQFKSRNLLFYHIIPIAMLSPFILYNSYFCPALSLTALLCVIFLIISLFCSIIIVNISRLIHFYIRKWRNGIVD